MSGETVRGTTKEEQLYRRLVESSQDAILIKTLDGEITFWNRAAQRLYGYSRQEAVGRHIGMLIPAGLKDEEAGLLRRLARGERIEHYETRRTTRDGRTLDIDVTLWPIRSDDGTITSACSVARDITDRRRTEAELAGLLAQQRHIALALHLMGTSEPVPGVPAASRYLPSLLGQGVGGDWLDVIDLGAGRVGVFVGDVMGRGLDAAVVMGQLRSAARALALAGLPPGELMKALDVFTTQTLPEQFVTCVYLEADPGRGELTACSAGHLPVLLVGADTAVAPLAVPINVPLGVGGSPHQQVCLPLPAGSTLALYTDGLVETAASDLDQQLELLSATLRASFAAGADLETAADRVLHALLPSSTTCADDVTLLLIGFPTVPLDSAELTLDTAPLSVRAGRHFVHRHLRSWRLDALADTALLLASELLTNAVCHARGPLTLRIWRSARQLGVEVTDRTAPRPQARPADPAEENGRGLLLVGTLADAWGTRPTATGKTVWFTLLTARTDAGPPPPFPRQAYAARTRGEVGLRTDGGE
ncbi:SpoIIE family protein phosphatase [Streptomyces sp. JW3]|uniref:SpoIIE family protein phosphatase n=1 Tax=Streptomyces sp. JW3 TaxID=3456955 RepID=UPI003FA4D3F1